MNLAVRTVRRLDERSETRTVNGFVIEAGIPLPNPHARTGLLQGALLALQVGESIEHEHPCKGARSLVTAAHKERGFASRKMPNGKHRVWRTK